MSEEMREIIQEFLIEAEESLDRIDPLFVELEAKKDDRELLNEIFRSMHTIKGAAGFLGFRQVVDVAHGAEGILKKLRDGEIRLTRPLMDVILKSVDMLRTLLGHIKAGDGVPEDSSALVKELEEALSGLLPPEEAALPHRTNDTAPAQAPAGDASGRRARGAPKEAASGLGGHCGQEAERAGAERKGALHTLRVEVEKIDKVMNLTGEVVLIRNRLLNVLGNLEKRCGDDPSVQNLFEIVSFLDLVTTDMQLAVMKMRMQPIRKVFGKFPRLVRDIAASLGKEVELAVRGEETEVDKSVIEQIGDPLVHIIRNAIDHGLEGPRDRKAGGKAEKGLITIGACQRGNQIVIEVSDDGRGIDVERVKQKALERSLAAPEEIQRMDDEAAVNLIFLPGFSTAQKVSELSGRGVGMDVVRTNIAKLKGYVEVQTMKGGGSTFRISIPLTLAITEILMVRTGSRHYAIPLAPVEGILKLSPERIKEIMGQKVVVIRERAYPVYDLSDLLGGNGAQEAGHRYAIVVSVGDRQFCLAVDELLGREEVVIKNVHGLDGESPYVLGATISGDGKVVLILDLAHLSRAVCATARC